MDPSRRKLTKNEQGATRSKSAPYGHVGSIEATFDDGVLEGPDQDFDEFFVPATAQRRTKTGGGIKFCKGFCAFWIALSWICVARTIGPAPHSRVYILALMTLM